MQRVNIIEDDLKLLLIHILFTSYSYSQLYELKQLEPFRTNLTILVSLFMKAKHELVIVEISSVKFKSYILPELLEVEHISTNLDGLITIRIMFKTCKISKITIL